MKILQNSDVPIYRQIASQFKDDIMNGRISEGEYLPSIRGLARDLKISVITTMKAYELLTEDDRLRIRTGHQKFRWRQGRKILHSRLRRLWYFA